LPCQVHSLVGERATSPAWQSWVSVAVERDSEGHRMRGAAVTGAAQRNEASGGAQKPGTERPGRRFSKQPGQVARRSRTRHGFGAAAGSTPKQVGTRVSGVWVKLATRQQARVVSVGKATSEAGGEAVLARTTVGTALMRS